MGSRTRSQTRKRKRESLSPKTNKVDVSFIFNEGGEHKRDFVVLPIRNWVTERIAFFKSSGQSNVGHDIYKGSWFPTTGLLKEDEKFNEYTEGSIIKTQYFLEKFSYKNRNATKTWFFPEWFVPIFYETNTIFNKQQLNTLNYKEVTKHIDTLTDLKHVDDYHDYFNNWKNIIVFLRYFFTKEQFMLSSQLGGGYWENNEIMKYIKSFVNKEGSIEVNKNSPPILRETEKVNEQLRNENAYYGFNTQDFFEKYDLNSSQYINIFGNYLGYYFVGYLDTKKRTLEMINKMKSKTKKGGYIKSKRTLKKLIMK
jgi:hypothetical protein